MSLKLKVLGLGLIAALAMSAVAVMNASATSTGEFHIDVPEGQTGTIIGSENTTHRTELTSHGIAGGIVCDKTSYEGSSGPTTTHITIIPKYEECRTTSESPGSTKVDVNGCSYTFTPGHHATAHLDCPAGKGIEITHPSCTIRITPQTATGVTYLTDVDVTGGGVEHHTITLTLDNVQFSSEYEAGICIFTGTNHTGTLNGSATVKGFQGETQVDITHTAT